MRQPKLVDILKMRGRAFAGANPGRPLLPAAAGIYMSARTVRCTDEDRQAGMAILGRHGRSAITPGQ